MAARQMLGGVEAAIAGRDVAYDAQASFSMGLRYILLGAQASRSAAP